MSSCKRGAVLQLGGIGAPHACGPLLRATVAAGSCIAPAVAAAATAGTARVALPTPIAIATLSASSRRLTCAAATSTLPPLLMPSSSTLSATVQLSDGSRRELSGHFANFTLAQGSSPACSLSTAPDGRTVVRIRGERGAACVDGRCGVILTYPTLNSTIIATLDVSVTDVQRLMPLALSYNASPADCIAAVGELSRADPQQRSTAVEEEASVQEDPSVQLRPLACSLQDYQQATVCVAAEISMPELAVPYLGTNTTHARHALRLPADNAAVVAVDVTAHAKLYLMAANASAASAGALILENLVHAGVINRIRPRMPGNYTVTAHLGTVNSRPMRVDAMASEDAVHVAGISIALPPPPPQHRGAECSALCAATLAGHANDTAVLPVALQLSDGYMLTLHGAVAGAEGRPQRQLLDIPAVLQFEASAAGTVAVSPWGEATLLASAAGRVRLGVSSACTVDGRAVASSAFAYVNLRPEYMDVDLGTAVGPPVSGSGSLAAGVQVCPAKSPFVLLYMFSFCLAWVLTAMAQKSRVDIQSVSPHLLRARSHANRSTDTRRTGTHSCEEAQAAYDHCCCNAHEHQLPLGSWPPVTFSPCTRGRCAPGPASRGEAEPRSQLKWPARERLQVSSSFTVALTANTGGAPVVAADVEVAFEERSMRVTACAPGAAIAHPAGFECRFNMPGLLGSAQVSYVSMGDDVEPITAGGSASDPAEGLLELALLTFQVLIARLNWCHPEADHCFMAQDSLLTCNREPRTFTDENLRSRCQ